MEGEGQGMTPARKERIHNQLRRDSERRKATKVAEQQTVITVHAKATSPVCGACGKSHWKCKCEVFTVTERRLP
jgi:hypothetical protein